MILAALVFMALLGAVVAVLGLLSWRSNVMVLAHRAELLHVDGDFLKSADGRVVGKVLR